MSEGRSLMPAPISSGIKNHSGPANACSMLSASTAALMIRRAAPVPFQACWSRAAFPPPVPISSTAPEGNSRRVISWIPISSPARPNIICNPPASKLVAFVEQALRRVRAGRLGGGGARAAQMGGLARSLRPVFRPEMERMVVLSRRPSCPPDALLQAQGEGVRKGGSIDFAWYLWRVGKAHAGARVGWLKPKQFGARSGRIPKRQRKPWTAARKRKGVRL